MQGVGCTWNCSFAAVVSLAILVPADLLEAESLINGPICQSNQALTR
jgi:hypothetical protein